MALINQVALLSAVILSIVVRDVSMSSCDGRIMLLSGSVTEAEKLTILNAHNLLRQQVALGLIPGQPQASNLQEIKWDDELALRAQQWSGCCLSEEHDEERHVSRFEVGQNIATIWTTKRPTTKFEVIADYADAIKRWFDEYRNYNFQKVFQADNSIGHYTQMTWADTSLVGCGYSFYYDQVKGFTKNYVCNYGPSGNVINNYPYVPGQPQCAANGMQSSYRYTGLCEKPEKPNRSEVYYYNFKDDNSLQNLIETLSQ